MVGGVTGGRREAAMPTDAQPPSESNARAVERLVERDIPAVLGGFSALPPPPADGLFCKPAYACPYYLWRRPYFGVAFDLWSVGATLFCMLEGVELYRTPIPGLDAGFSLLWDSEAAYALREPPGDDAASAGEMASLSSISLSAGTAASSPVSLSARRTQSDSIPEASPPPSLASPASGPSGGFAVPPPQSRFEAFLARRSAARVAAGLPPLSPAVVDLLCRLLRVRPQFRPLSAQGALMHAWFSEDTQRHRLV